jgi:hypothetical protein
MKGEQNMKLPDKIYDVLKWLVVICIPALTVAYVGLDSVFGWGYGDTVSKVSSIICVLLGSLIGISTAEYNRLKQPPND